MKYKNEYKRQDIFRCRHDVHEKFEYNVSTYHILRRKNCFRNGCIYFRWHCKLFEKGKPCYRGYSHIGRLCDGCKYFYDEKVHNCAQLRVSEKDYEEYLLRLQEFEDWLEANSGREIEVEARVENVQPRFDREIRHKHSRTSLRGFQATFAEAFVGMDHLEDVCYAHLGANQQERLRLSAGMRIEFRCNLTLDRGRIVFERLRGLHVLESSGKPAWTKSDALVARSIATPFDVQASKCLKCEFGALVDVTMESGNRDVQRRQLFCLQGVAHPDDCTLHTGPWVEVDECQK
jgi:hypothetical protein